MMRHSEKKSRRLILLFFLMTLAFLLIPASLFAESQTPPTETEEHSIELKTDEEKTQLNMEESPHKNHSLFIGAGPMLMVSTNSTKKSAPSPVMFGGGLGATLFQKMPISAQPRLTFFTNYYLWDGNSAHPAEVENRTALAFSFLLDLNAVKIIRLKKHTLQAGAGISILIRAGVLANGVSSTDSGGTADSTAGDDVSSINNWFWSDAHFLYPNLTFCWLYELPIGWRAGVSANLYIPVGSLLSGNGMDGTIISIAARLEF